MEKELDFSRISTEQLKEAVDEMPQSMCYDMPCNKCPFEIKGEVFDCIEMCADRYGEENIQEAIKAEYERRTKPKQGLSSIDKVEVHVYLNLIEGIIKQIREKL